MSIRRVRYCRPVSLCILVLVALWFSGAPLYGQESKDEQAPAKRSVTVQRTCKVAQGQGQAAGQWAKEITAYVNSHYSEVSARAYWEMFGDLGTVHWLVDYKDLATLEAVGARLKKDSRYLELIAKASGLFGDCEDTLLRSM